jgi:hypothetical protein
LSGNEIIDVRIGEPAARSLAAMPYEDVTERTGLDVAAERLD